MFPLFRSGFFTCFFSFHIFKLWVFNGFNGATVTGDSTLQETIRDESCESSRIVNSLTAQLLPTASRLPFRRFDFAGDDSRRIVWIESNRQQFDTGVIAYRESISVYTIRLSRRRFETIRDESCRIVNRDRERQSREEPTRETTEKPLVFRGFAALCARAQTA